MITTSTTSNTHQLQIDNGLPACFGHRGASAGYPENTMAAFKGAILDGSEGIESDVHICSDDVIVMFHDPELDHLTDGKGDIPSQPFYNNIEHLRTKQCPPQPIPKFEEALDLIMQPDNYHVKFNIDIKPDNPPERLFKLMNDLVTKYEDFETKLAPRLILGLWHPKFIQPAKTYMPYANLAHIGMSLSLARDYFFDHVNVLSMSFNTLVGSDGLAFRQECKNANKKIMVWTVNNRSEMIEAAKWNVDGIITDETKYFVQLRKDMQVDFNNIANENGFLFPWSSIKYYRPLLELTAFMERKYIESKGGVIEASA